MTKPLPGGECSVFDCSRPLDELFGYAVANVIVPNSTHPVNVIPPLPSNPDTVGGGLFYPTGSFSGCWFSEELKLARKYGAQIELVEAIQFNPVSPHKSFIQEFHALKTAYKKEPAKRATVKGILNTSYGRMALNPPIDAVAILPFSQLSDFMQTYEDVSPHELKIFDNPKDPLFIVNHSTLPNPALKDINPSQYYALREQAEHNL